MGSPYSDLDRPPLRLAALQAALVRPGSLWTGLRLVDATGSTNADLAAAAAGGAPAGTVLVAESQTAGRGRLNREWVSPPRAGLTFSVLFRPAVPRRSWGWVPLLTGAALARAVAAVAEVEVALRWPNDLLGADGAKLAGVLAELTAGPAGEGVVVGVGLNVTTRAAEFAGLPAATSLALAGGAVLDRETLLRAVLRELETAYRAWEDSGGAPVAGYVPRCATIGSQVRIALPGGRSVTGTATAVDAEGRLVLHTAEGERAFSAGDVEHLR